jgi:hypothetical protein
MFFVLSFANPKVTSRLNTNRAGTRFAILISFAATQESYADLANPKQPSDATLPGNYSVSVQATGFGKLQGGKCVDRSVNVD